MDDKIAYLKKYLKDKDFDIAIKELEEGKPLQYIVGNVDFYGYEFRVNENTLIPRFETELLVNRVYDFICNYMKSDSVKILDIGTGSGCIAITLSMLLNVLVDAVDISLPALEVAKENCFSNGANVNFIQSDVFSNVSNKYDVIISNPPYIAYDEDIMPIVYDNEPHIALFASMNGLYFYDKILSKCKDYLNDRFLIAFEIGASQGNSVKNLACKYLGNVNVSILKDYSDRDRFVFISNIC